MGLVGTASAVAPHTSLSGVLVRLVISLVVVLGVIWLMAQYVKHRGIPGTKRSSMTRSRGSNSAIEILARQQLGKGTALLAVRVGATHLLVGVTSQSVSALGQLDAETLTLSEDGGHQAADSSITLEPPGRAKGIFPLPALQARGGATAGLGWSYALEQLRDMTTRRS